MNESHSPLYFKVHVRYVVTTRLAQAMGHLVGDIDTNQSLKTEKPQGQQERIGGSFQVTKIEDVAY